MPLRTMLNQASGAAAVVARFFTADDALDLHYVVPPRVLTQRPFA